MKNKSCHSRRTKIVRRSKKNLRRTIKRKRLGKGRRHPTRRYSRVQRGGEPGSKDYDDAMTKLKGTNPTIYKIIELLRTAARKGHTKANFELGRIYEGKSEYSSSESQKIQWIGSAIKQYITAVKRGNDEATLALSRLIESQYNGALKDMDYYTSSRDPYYITYAIEKYKNAAIGGNLLSLEALKTLISDGISGEQFSKRHATQAMEELEKFIKSLEKKRLEEFDTEESEQPDGNAAAAHDANVV